MDDLLWQMVSLILAYKMGGHAGLDGVLWLLLVWGRQLHAQKRVPELQVPSLQSAEEPGPMQCTASENYPVIPFRWVMLCATGPMEALSAF